MPNLNFAQSYEQYLLSEFPYVLYFGALFAAPNNNRYQWLNEDTIQIPSITVKGRTDGDMETISTATRNFENRWTPLKVQNHRQWKTLVHPRQIQMSNMTLTLQNITREYNEQQKFPEMNAYLISKLYADFLAQSQTAVNTALTVENILSIIDKWMEDMDDARVPRAGRLLYVTPQTKTLINNAKDIARHFDVQSGNAVIRRAVNALDDLQIEPSVPSDMMKTVYDFTEGWEVDASAKQINMVLVHPQAVITPVHYEFAKLDPPAAGSDGKYVYFEESFEDVFLLPTRGNAVKFHVEA